MASILSFTFFQTCLFLSLLLIPFSTASFSPLPRSPRPHLKRGTSPSNNPQFYTKYDTFPTAFSLQTFPAFGPSNALFTALTPTDIRFSHQITSTSPSVISDVYAGATYPSHINASQPYTSRFTTTGRFSLAGHKLRVQTGGTIYTAFKAKNKDANDCSDLLFKEGDQDRPPSGWDSFSFSTYKGCSDDGDVGKDKNPGECDASAIRWWVVPDDDKKYQFHLQYDSTLNLQVCKRGKAPANPPDDYSSLSSTQLDNLAGWNFLMAMNLIGDNRKNSYP